MRINRNARVLIWALVLACTLPELAHFLRFGHLAPLGLHGDVIAGKVDIGIPGISKTYEPKFTNFGLLPRTVRVCEVRKDWDSLSYAEEVDNTIEKWNPQSKEWENIFKNPEEFASCPHARARGLWPLQSVSGGEVAMAAYETFAIGDRARFVVFPGNNTPMPTIPIVIDEHPTVTGVNFRLR